MKTNLSIYDSAIRLFAAIIFGAICGAFGWIIGVLTIYPVVTALTAHDPIYQLLGYSTADLEEHHNEPAHKKPKIQSVRPKMRPLNSDVKRSA